MRSMVGKLWQASGERLLRALGPLCQRLGAPFRPLLAQAGARYQKLEPRERRLISAAAALFAVFLAYNFIYVPIQNFSADLQARIELRQRQLTEVRRLVGTYVQRKAELEAAEKRTTVGGADFSLFSVLETALTQSVGHDKIGSITPAADRKVSGGFIEHTVQLKLQNLSLTQIVDALYKVRSLATPVAVFSLRITRRAQETHAYDVDMTCVALAKGK